MSCLFTTGFILAVSNCEYFHICTWCRDVYLLGIMQRPRCVFVGCNSAQYQSDEFNNPFQLIFIVFFLCSTDTPHLIFTFIFKANEYT